MMFLAIERERNSDFTKAVNEALSQGFKIINSGFSRIEKTKHESFGSYKIVDTIHWAYLINNQNQNIGEYPYPPTRTLE
jgi:hypothetical protein